MSASKRQTHEQMARQIRMDRSLSTGLWWMEIRNLDENIVFEVRGLETIAECLEEIECWVHGHRKNKRTK